MSATEKRLVQMEKRMRELEHEVNTLRSELDALQCSSFDLVPVTVLADELGCTPRTIKNKCKRRGVPIRLENGDIKRSQKNTRPYVSRIEWRRGEQGHGRSIKKRIRKQRNGQA